MVFTSLSAVLQMFNSEASSQITKFLDCLLAVLSVGEKPEKCSKPLDHLRGFTKTIWNSVRTASLYLYLNSYYMFKFQS